MCFRLVGFNRGGVALFAEKLDGMFQKTVGKLELRGVPGVRVDEQLGIRNVLGHVPGIDGRNHHVVHPIEDECRLLDFTQVRERGSCVEFGQVVHVGLDLGLYDCGRTGRILVLAHMSAFPEGASRLFRGFRATEEEIQEIVDSWDWARCSLQYAGL